MDVVAPLGLRCWTLELSVGIFRLVEEYGVDQILGLLALARANDIVFSEAGERGWFPFKFEDSIVYDLRAF